MRTDADRVDVSELVDLQRAENCKIEKMYLPVDEIDHLRKIHHGLATFEIAMVCGRADDAVVCINHPAGAGDPPQRRRMHVPREIAGGDLYIAVGADNRPFAVAQVASEKHR